MRIKKFDEHINENDSWEERQERLHHDVVEEMYVQTMMYTPHPRFLIVKTKSGQEYRVEVNPSEKGYPKK